MSRCTVQCRGWAFAPSSTTGLVDTHAQTILDLHVTTTRFPLGSLETLAKTFSSSFVIAGYTSSGYNVVFLISNPVSYLTSADILVSNTIKVVTRQ